MRTAIRLPDYEFMAQDRISNIQYYNNISYYTDALSEAYYTCRIYLSLMQSGGISTIYVKYF